jgi:hypothetical protein
MMDVDIAFELAFVFLRYHEGGNGECMFWLGVTSGTSICDGMTR